MRWVFPPQHVDVKILNPGANTVQTSSSALVASGPLSTAMGGPPNLAGARAGNTCVNVGKTCVNATSNVPFPADDSPEELFAASRGQKVGESSDDFLLRRKRERKVGGGQLGSDRPQELEFEASPAVGPPSIIFVEENLQQSAENLLLSNSMDQLFSPNAVWTPEMEQRAEKYGKESVTVMLKIVLDPPLVGGDNTSR
eukprot:g17153.t1